MVNTKLRGTGVALVTPFNKDQTIDYKSFEKLVNYQLKNGVDYLLLMGTTGETPTINREEKKELLQHLKKQVNNQIPIILGVGGNNTKAVVDEINSYDLQGVEAILSVSPYYNKPSQEGLFEHYTMIANSSPLPIVLYNVQGRTSSNIEAATTLRLSKNENIIGIKEASGNLGQMAQILKDRPNGFLVISGDDALALPLISLGGDGVISVIANALPLPFSTMVKYALNNDYEKARKIHFQLINIIKLLFAEGNPSGIKATLKVLNIIQNNLRLPLTPVSEECFAKIEEEINKLEKK